MSKMRVQSWVKRWDFLIGVEETDDENLYEIVMIIWMDMHSECGKIYLWTIQQTRKKIINATT